MNTGFTSMHPLVCLIYFVLIIVFSMMFFHPIYLIITLIGLVSLIFILDQGKALLNSWKYILFTGLIIAILNPLLSHRGSTILFYFYDNPITLEAISYGLLAMLSLINIFIAFILFQQIINHQKFMYLFSNISPKTSLLIMMSIRFFPLLKRKLSQIASVQKTRGIDVKEGTLIKRVTDGMQLLHTLVLSSMEEAFQTSESMDARGFGKFKRSSYSKYIFELRDLYFFISMLIISSILFVGYYLGKCNLSIYPSLGQITFTQTDLFLIILFTLFINIPIAIEWKEKMTWNSLK